MPTQRGALDVFDLELLFGTVVRARGAGVDPMARSLVCPTREAVTIIHGRPRLGRAPRSAAAACAIVAATRCDSTGVVCLGDQAQRQTHPEMATEGIGDFSDEWGGMLKVR
ncbi:MAG: hypothetical protein ACYCVV_18390 [Acidimicrobiales bacterium]